MSVVRININKREYEIACPDGEEQHLHNLSLELDRRVKDLYKTVGTGNQTLLIIVAALQLLDEYYQSRLQGIDPANVQDEVDKLASATISQVTDKVEDLIHRLERGTV